MSILLTCMRYSVNIIKYIVNIINMLLTKSITEETLMLTTLFQRNFALLWLGGLISLAGDWMLGIALPIYVYQLTGSALATSLMFIAETLPRILLGSVAGVFADRWERKRLMVITNLLLAVGLLPLLLLQSAAWVWVVYLVGFAEAAVSQFF